MIGHMSEDTPKDENYSQQQGYFRAVDGVKLYYSWEGPKDAPTLLFCYGLVCSTLQWKYQLSYFRKHYRVLYMDYRGHNNSEVPIDFTSVNLKNLGRDLASLLDELGLGPVPAIGHSLGVNAILEMYRQYPQKISKMVLISGTPKDPFETMFQHNFLQPTFNLIRRLYFSAPELVKQLWKLQSINPINQEFIARAGFNKEYAKQEDINEYLRVTGTINVGVFMQLLSDFTRYNACYWLEDIKVPTLVIGGALDKITPIQQQEILAKLIPNAELEILPEGSHNAQLEFPDQVNEMLEKFLTKKTAANKTNTTNKKRKKVVQKKRVSSRRPEARS